MELIAEVGCNWTSMGNAKDYIHKCKELGIKFVKFQMFKPEQVPASVKHLIIGKREAAELFAFGQLEDVNVFFTPFYVEAVDILEELGVHYYKIRYNDRDNKDLYKKIVQTQKPYFISRQVPKCYVWGIQLYCVPKYPAKPEDYYVMFSEFQGISDHTATTRLLYETLMNIPDMEWFECHVCYSHEDIEGKWSKTFEELEEVL